MSSPHSSPQAWITYPCPEDRALAADATHCSLAPAEISTEGLQVCLPRMPRVGTLLSAALPRAPQSFAAPLVARVTAVRQHKAGWLAHGKWIEVMTEEIIRTFLNTAEK
jgi:hypothetical protein